VISKENQRERSLPIQVLNDRDEELRVPANVIVTIIPTDRQWGGAIFTMMASVY
jgi:hypothetical protein